jgi:hypothetical protein
VLGLDSNSLTGTIPSELGLLTKLCESSIVLFACCNVVCLLVVMIVLCVFYCTLMFICHFFIHLQLPWGSTATV